MLGLFFGQSVVFCQTQPALSITFDEYKYFVGRRHVYVCEIIIENKDDNIYVLWLDSIKVEKYSNKEKINSYFFRRKADFSFYDLMVENLLKNAPPILFGTFLKQIGNREKFIIGVIGNKSIINECKRFIKKHFVAVEKEELLHELKLTDDFFPWFDRQCLYIKSKLLILE